ERRGAVPIMDLRKQCRLAVWRIHVVSAESPEMAVQVASAVLPRPVALVFERHDDVRAGGHRPRMMRVYVLQADVNALLDLGPGVAGNLVRGIQADDGLAQLELSVRDAAVGIREHSLLHKAECVHEPVNSSGRILVPERGKDVWARAHGN